MRTPSLTLWLLWVWSLSGGTGFERDGRQGADGAEAQLGGARRRGLGAVSSVDELLELLYPQYALVQRCLRGRGQGTPSRLRPDEVTWEDPHEAALHWDDGAIQVIMAEMERTACRPREVCLEVSREYPESPRHVYVPRCVSVHRCGGCCNHEALHCSNSSHRLVNKTVSVSHTHTHTHTHYCSNSSHRLVNKTVSVSHSHTHTTAPTAATGWSTRP
ncbi:vascular endothelial growth factor C-like [Anguilla rostrata]|uniref:vascular endothelial growth factor C-like n=1 Tax=Anguilla rostrata TaxID=7938 RepID=UPI0030CC9D9C